MISKTIFIGIHYDDMKCVVFHTISRPRFDTVENTPLTKSPKNAVGPQLVQLRTARGWSQQEFASKCQLRAWDISRDIVARIELQTRCVTDIELLKLASVLKVPVQILLPEQRSK